MAKAIKKIVLNAAENIPYDKLVLSQKNVRRIKDGVSIEQLAEDILDRARAGKGVSLSPDTAYFLGLKLQKVSELPTHEALIKVLCGLSRCERTCTNCRAKANVIAERYGFSVEGKQSAS